MGRSPSFVPSALLVLLLAREKKMGRLFSADFSQLLNTERTVFKLEKKWTKRKVTAQSKGEKVLIRAEAQISATPYLAH